jgi:hypothetical protein
VLVAQGMVSQSVTQFVSMMLPTGDALLPVTLNDIAGTVMAEKGFLFFLCLLLFLCHFLLLPLPVFHFFVPHCCFFFIYFSALLSLLFVYLVCLFNFLSLSLLSLSKFPLICVCMSVFHFH